MNDWDQMAEEEAGGEELDFLCIRTADAVYGLELSCVMEIVWGNRITPVPCIPDYYEGICNWKGTIIPVASFARASGEECRKSGEEPVIIITRSEGLECGFLVWKEPEIMHVKAEDRLTGDAPDRKGEVLKLLASYSCDNQVIYVVDLGETLRNMVVFA